MSFFSIACAFHDTPRLLERTLPQAVRALTRPTRHDYEVVLVAEVLRDCVAHGFLLCCHTTQGKTGPPSRRSTTGALRQGAQRAPQHPGRSRRAPPGA